MTTDVYYSILVLQFLLHAFESLFLGTYTFSINMSFSLIDLFIIINLKKISDDNCIYSFTFNLSVSLYLTCSCFLKFEYDVPVYIYACLFSEGFFSGGMGSMGRYLSFSQLPESVGLIVLVLKLCICYTF